jgi:hypothetical protein
MLRQAGRLPHIFFLGPREDPGNECGGNELGSGAFHDGGAYRLCTPNVPLSATDSSGRPWQPETVEAADLLPKK